MSNVCIYHFYKNEHCYALILYDMAFLYTYTLRHAYMSWFFLFFFLKYSKVKFNKRKANEVAHTFAGVATLSTSLNIYYHVPRCINTLIINEML